MHSISEEYSAVSICATESDTDDEITRLKQQNKQSIPKQTETVDISDTSISFPTPPPPPPPPKKKNGLEQLIKENKSLQESSRDILKETKKLKDENEKLCKTLSNRNTELTDCRKKRKTFC